MKTHNKSPPSSNRFCPCCDKITVFSYNRNIFHSVCDDCGNHRSFNSKENYLDFIAKRGFVE